MSITTDGATIASVTTEERDFNISTVADNTASNDPTHRDWIPTCWSAEARSIPGVYRFDDRVKPWNWLELDANEAEKLWSLLFGFVAFFNRRYGETIDHQIPPCWAEHGAIVEELTTLVFARWHAFESLQGSVGGAQYWHSYTLPAFYGRIREWLGDDLLACQQGRHRDHEDEDLETHVSWAARRERISSLDVAMRGSVDDQQEHNGIEIPHGVEVPYLGDPSVPHLVHRASTKT